MAGGTRRRAARSIGSAKAAWSKAPNSWRAMALQRETATSDSSEYPATHHAGPELASAVPKHGMRSMRVWSASARRVRRAGPRARGVHTSAAVHDTVATVPSAASARLLFASRLGDVRRKHWRSATPISAAPRRAPDMATTAAGQTGQKTSGASMATTAVPPTNKATTGRNASSTTWMSDCKVSRGRIGKARSACAHSGFHNKGRIAATSIPPVTA